MEDIKDRKGYVVDQTLPAHPDEGKPIIRNAYQSTLKDGLERELPISGDLFSERFPGPQVKKEQLVAKYVSEVFTLQKLANGVFEEWTLELPSPLSSNTFTAKLPILISAQTGKGKNFFVITSLRQYAKQRRAKILYIGNRIALNFQMKLQLAEETGKKLRLANWKNENDFDNVTVISYQGLKAFIKGAKPETLREYRYVVLDECHYFYSDSLFNAFTGEMLTYIPKAFKDSFRIYLSATPDCVLAPIYSAELNAIFDSLQTAFNELETCERSYKQKVVKKDAFYTAAYQDMEESNPAFFHPSEIFWEKLLKDGPQYIIESNKSYFKNLDRLPYIKIYDFQRDYSVYRNIAFFTPASLVNGKIDINRDPIYKAIIGTDVKKETDQEEKKCKLREKWLVYIPSKEYGRALAESLKEKHINTVYFDRNSQDSDDITERIAWGYLLEKGNMDNTDVIITTSVLDNGFSIKGQSVRNIVIFSDEKTDFLQELGRVRLENGQKIKLYISKMPTNISQRRRRNAQSKKVLEVYYRNSSNKRDDAFQALQIAKKEFPESLPDYIELTPHKTDSKAVTVHMNHMAYYRTLFVEKELSTYAQMLESDSKSAPILYKLKWLFPDLDSTIPDNIIYDDLDIGAKKQLAKELEEFLNGYIDNPPTEADQEYGVMVNRLQDLYKKTRIYIKELDSWKNPSREIKSDGLNNRLRDLQKYLNEYMEYHYIIGGKGKDLVIKKQPKCD